MKNKKLGFGDFVRSQYAIEDYMYFNEDNCYIHKARVHISSNEKTLYNDITQVVFIYRYE
jgi:hypothetical protein